MNQVNYDEYLYYFNEEEKEKIVEVCKYINSNVEIIKYHPIIKKVKEKHREQDIYNKKYPYSANEFETDPDVRNRIYKILHLIFVNLEKLGYKAEYDNGLVALILDEKIRFRIREKGSVTYEETTDFLYPNGKKRVIKPNGTLELLVENYDHKQHIWLRPKREFWADTNKTKLENVIGNFILELIYCATNKIVEKKKREEEAKQKQIREQILKTKREIQNNEIKKFEQLEKNAQNYERANRIRNYIDIYSKKDNITESDKEYIKWALEKADWLDPFKDKIDPIMDEILY